MTDKEFKKRVKAIKKKMDAFEKRLPMLTAFRLANELLDQREKKGKKPRGI